MRIVTLTKKDIEQKPYSIWNSFVELLASCEYEELSPQQRPAHLVFWYESEVQNGGHLQYFENRGVERLRETVQALGLLNALCQQEVLRGAGELFLSRERQRVATVEEYVSTALEGEFDRFDQMFGRCCPSLQECLEQHLHKHQTDFITVID